ncbi:hypothetical protein [Palaeococcus ferrophilus]|uniref:hypothetical protein n=1 Tax=Palaeococcus ferrophilus TaxID=83868 RepID=UPI00064E2118|nr:hypothetical protein [Palaeococcus ferrophilus]
MRLKLAYPDCLVEVNGEEVYTFCGRLFRASLSEIRAYVEGRDSILPEPIKRKARDIVSVLDHLNMGRGYYTAPHGIRAA